MSGPTFNKTRLSFAPFDRAFGGIFFNRPTLIWGPRNSGRSLLAAQFVAKVIQSGERICILADSNPDPFFLDLKSLDVDVAKVINSKQLLALSCKGFTGISSTGILPFPKAIEELGNLVKEQSVGFVVFHSVVPWIAVQPDETEARVDEFVSATERFGITSLFTLPRPVSPAAIRLRNVLADRCPIVLRMEASDIGERHITVERYRGAVEASLPAVYPVAIVPGRGFVARDEISRKSTEIPALAAARAAAPHRHHHQALITPSGEIAPVVTSQPQAPISSGPAAHPRHPQRHHSLLNPATIAPPAPVTPDTATPSPASAPAPKRFAALAPMPAPPVPDTPPSAPAPAPRRFAALASMPVPPVPDTPPPTPAPAPRHFPVPPLPDTPHTTPANPPSANETNTPGRRHRFSSIIK